MLVQNRIRQLRRAESAAKIRKPPSKEQYQKGRMDGSRKSMDDRARSVDVLPKSEMIQQEQYQEKEDPYQTNLPEQIQSKGDLFDSVPLFLSKEYELMYKKSKTKMQTRSMSVAEQANLLEKMDKEKKERKGASRLYKSKWLQEKCLQ